jgi:hypothetical protein
VPLTDLDGDIEDFFFGGGLSSSLSSSLEMKAGILRFRADDVDGLGAGSSSLSLITALLITALEALELEAWFDIRK